MPGSDVEVVAKETGDKMDMDVDEKGNFSGFFSNFPYRAKGEPTLLEDDILVFTITNNEVGYSADFELDVLPRSDDPNYTEPVSPNDE